MSGIISGRARVVFCSPEFLHLSKGGLDGKIVAYRDSWVSKSFEMQDWVTFKAKPHDAEGTHCTYGVRYRALPSSVKFEAKGKIIDGIGTLLKVDENQGQYGFIKANDGSTVYFTASVVRPETKDIRSVFKAGVQIKYRATEQKQNTVQWRAIAVCSKNANIDSLMGRQPKSLESSLRSNNNGVLLKKINNSFSSAAPVLTNVKSNSVPVKNQSTDEVTMSSTGDSTKSSNATAISDLRSRSNSSTRPSTDYSDLDSLDPPNDSSLVLSPQFDEFLKSLPGGNSYDDAVERLAYITSKIVSDVPFNSYVTY